MLTTRHALRAITSVNIMLLHADSHSISTIAQGVEVMSFTPKYDKVISYIYSDTSLVQLIT